MTIPRHLRVIRRFVSKRGQAMATFQDKRTKRTWTAKNPEKR